MITIKPQRVENTYWGLVLSSEKQLNGTYFTTDYKSLPGDKFKAIRLSIFPKGKFYFGLLHLVALDNQLNRRTIPKDLEELVQERECSMEIKGKYIHFLSDSRDLLEFGFFIDTSTIRPDFLLRKNQKLSRRLKGIIYSLEFGHYPTNMRMIASHEQFRTEIENAMQITQEILNKTNTSLRYPYSNPKVYLSLKPMRKASLQ